MKRVKTLAVGKEWIKTLRPPNTLYQNDKIYELNGVGETKERHFLSANINTVKQLLQHQGEVPGIGKNQ